MSDLDIRTQVYEKLKAGLLASCNEASVLAEQAKNEVLEAQRLLDEAIKINNVTESPTSVQDDPDDEWGDLVIEDPKITKLKADVARLDQKAEQLNKEAENAMRANKVGPTEAEIKREVSLLRGAIEKAASIVREQAIKAEKLEKKAIQAEIDRQNALMIAQQEEERWAGISPADRAKIKFIEEYKFSKGFDYRNRGTNNKTGNPCCTPEETRLNKEAEAAWAKKLEQEKREASKAQVVSRPIFRREDCMFSFCRKFNCNYLHTLTKCDTSKRKQCVYYENCGNKHCTDLHTYKSIESTESSEPSEP